MGRLPAGGAVCAFSVTNKATAILLSPLSNSGFLLCRQRKFLAFFCFLCYTEKQKSDFNRERSVSYEKDSEIYRKYLFRPAVFPDSLLGDVLKNLLLQSFLWGNNHYRPSFIEGGWRIVFGIFFGLLVEGLLLIPGLLFKKEKNKLRLTVIVSVVFTVLCVVDACYYRSSAEMPSVRFVASGLKAPRSRDI